MALIYKEGLHSFLRIAGMSWGSTPSWVGLARCPCACVGFIPQSKTCPSGSNSECIAMTILQHFKKRHWRHQLEATGEANLLAEKIFVFFFFWHDTKWLRPNLYFPVFFSSKVIFKPALFLHRWKSMILIDLETLFAATATFLSSTQQDNYN